MPSKRFYTLTLLFLLAVLGYLSYQIFRTFLSPIAWAMVLSIVFYPVFSFLLRWVKWKPLASLITLVFIIVLLLGPFSYFSYLLSQEIRSLIDASTSGQFDPVGSILHNPKIRVIIDKVLLLLNVSQADLRRRWLRISPILEKASWGALQGDSAMLPVR